MAVHSVRKENALVVKIRNFLGPLFIVLFVLIRKAFRFTKNC